jgi:hypothetical protein
LDEEVERHAVGLDDFKTSLARKVDLGIRIELLFQAIWRWNPEGCSVRFAVDGHLFCTGSQRAEEYVLPHGSDVEMIPSLVLRANDKEFEDRLLIAIDDVLQQQQSA